MLVLCSSSALKIFLICQRQQVFMSEHTLISLFLFYIYVCIMSIYKSEEANELQVREQ